MPEGITDNSSMKSLPYLAVLLNSTDLLDSKANTRVAVIEFTRRLQARQTHTFGELRVDRDFKMLVVVRRYC